MFLCVCVCAHLLPEVQSPGNIGVGVVLFVGALMKLRLDGLRLYRKLSRNCITQVKLRFGFTFIWCPYFVKTAFIEHVNDLLLSCSLTELAILLQSCLQKCFKAKRWKACFHNLCITRVRWHLVTYLLWLWACPCLTLLYCWPCLEHANSK